MNKEPDLELSVLVPLFDEEENLRPLFAKIEEVLSGLGITWEAIFVDDGSTDGSFEVLRDLRTLEPRIRVFRLRRNFGKSAALDTGFKAVRGRRVIIMDADLQDDPAEIPVLLKKIDEGYDLVTGWRADRHDRLVKKYTSRLYNLVTSTLTGIRLHDFNCGLKAFRREVIENISLYGELHRYIPPLAHWKGYRVTEIRVRHHRRAFGKSKFGAYRFFAGFMDLLTVMFMTRYSKKPLHLFGGAGLILFLAGLVINGYLVMLNLLGKDFLRVRPLMFLGVLLMLVGFQLLSTGLLAELMTMSIHRKKEERVVREVLE
ncbi:MAG: glycosyltransferase family 2 protein [Candidatus Erginobacter occultus]|nr:glycosyltransferase family 2 protein [Candidatus Erginobacter occultus]